MPKTSSILAVLPRDALRHLLERHALRATDARKTDSIVRALSRGLPAQKSSWLTMLPVAALKSAVVALDLTPMGKGKAALVTALDGTEATKATGAANSDKPKKQKAPLKKAASTTKTTAKAKASAAKQSATPASKRTKKMASDAPSESLPAAANTEKETAVETEAEAASSAPRHMLSWTDAVALATKRGQSAATMIGQPMISAAAETVRCKQCRAPLEVQACQIHTCGHKFIAKGGQKICAECMFERNNMSMDTFHERLQADWQCAHCEADVPRPQA